MTVYYLDSSVWVKRYVSERGSRFATDLFSRNESLACSTLGLVEIVATIARKRKAGDLREPDWVLVTGRLRQDWERFYQVPLSAAVIDSAVHVAEKEALRGSDALHLASANLLTTFLHERGNHLIFVCSDRELNDAAERLGLSVIDPRDGAAL